MHSKYRLNTHTNTQEKQSLHIINDNKRRQTFQSLKVHAQEVKIKDTMQMIADIIKLSAFLCDNRAHWKGKSEEEISTEQSF